MARCQSTSSHGARCCFAQHANPLRLLLECHRTIWMQLNRANWHAHLKNSRVIMMHKLFSSYKTIGATIAYPADTGSHLCLIAASRTPCRRINEQDCRAIRTACCCLHSLRIRVEARANVTERAVISQQLQLMQASVRPHHTEDLNAANTSCPSRTSAQHFDDKTGPCPKN